MLTTPVPHPLMSIPHALCDLQQKPHNLICQIIFHGEWGMRRVNILILILILAGMFLTPAFGDVPIEGMKQYNYQYHINNTEEYPEYMFLTSS